MPLFVDPNRTKRYVPKDEREKPADQQHVFTLKTLSHREWEERHDYSRLVFDGDPQARVNLGTWVRWTLYYGLVNAEGPSLPCKVKEPDAKRVSDEFLDALHPDLRSELAREIERISRLDIDDPKE